MKRFKIKIIELTKFVVISVIFLSIAANAFAQLKHKKQVSSTTKTSCLCVADSLVREEPKIDSTIAASSIKPETKISAEISNLLKNKNSKNYISIVGLEILYYINIDKEGNVIDAKYFLHYPHQRVFDHLVIAYLKKLKFFPTHYIIENKNAYIKWERMMHIKIV